MTLIFSAVVSLALSCSVTLIGPYDEVTDYGIQEVQGEIFVVLVTIKKNLINNQGQDNAYLNFKATYNLIEGRIENLSIRSSTLPKYSLIVQQLTALQNSVEDLERIHQIGLNTKADTSVINTIENAFSVQFRSMIVLQNGLKRKIR
ncbi:hypothetical protein KHS38_10090 [Mucilaginibacter sp. Bleaf8]|uniref:hypothetical protein n=1 Tax=Mucilaginibacter sp. Bleaf8 TaxID=2834430 RepID=UPI001BCF544A|nr:hypothetical protein [Mucilaginibacter sp. Bleaf8]MBS7564754.1 hypothetical protein [Mucilaginibacter sp. Bleaf8]